MGVVSYSPSIVTMALSVVVCEIFSIKKWCDLENGLFQAIGAGRAEWE